MTHYTGNSDTPMKFTKESYFYLAPGMIIRAVALEYFVETFKEECPEARKGPKVTYEV